MVEEISLTCKSLNTDLLPAKLKQYIDSIVATTEAEPIMILMSVLCMMSAFVQHKCFIPEANGGKNKSGGYFQDLYTNLWTLCISRSGSFKTTALNKGFKIAYEQDSSSNSPILPNRTTLEGLLEDLLKVKGGAIICSEFGAWLETLGKSYNQGLKALFTDLYDVPTIYSYKTKSEGLKKLNKPFITICGVSTVEWIKNNIMTDDISSGFFARFLIFYPPQNSTTPPALPIPLEGPGLDTKSETDIKSVIKHLQDLKEPREYCLNQETKKIFEQFHNGLYEDFEKYPEKSQQTISPYIKRWSPYVLKIAILLQLFVDKTSSEIGPEALRSAIAIMGQAIDSTKWLFENDLGESDHQRKVRKVKEYIIKRGGQVKRKQLISSRILEGGTADYDYVLKTLEDGGEIIVEAFANKSASMIKLVQAENDNR